MLYLFQVFSLTKLIESCEERDFMIINNTTFQQFHDLLILFSVRRTPKANVKVYTSIETDANEAYVSLELCGFVPIAALNETLGSKYPVPEQTKESETL